MRKASRKSVKPTMSPEDEYELHDRHDASYERQMQSESTILKEITGALYKGVALGAMSKLLDKREKPEKTDDEKADEKTTEVTPVTEPSPPKDDLEQQDKEGNVIKRPGQDMVDTLRDLLGPTEKPTPGGEPVRVEPQSTNVTDDEREKSQSSSGKTISPSGKNESMFHIASLIREDDEDYSDEEISRDKDPDAAGGPYSEDDIKVSQDPRDAAPGMDPVADPPTLQAKQVTTAMAYKAPAAAGTMQTMLPGGEHDAIQKQYPDLIENLLGCGDDMKGGFMTSPKDKKKAMAAMAIMAQLDKKLKEDKKARVAKILNTKNPPAIPGSEGY
ncbi:hypothetical protein [Hyphomonas sp.]|uniref:hypothetical protein n=1 Tax=Hyphomonas sp. TaxID=87 RepID=UPI000C8DE3A8|nr:hypothetical protein [Hyphomonas sp.]MAL44217.1 hypothetical protein [Hyphomonas sp.]